MKLFVIIILGSLTLIGCSGALGLTEADVNPPAAAELKTLEQSNKIEQIRPGAANIAKDEIMNNKEETVTVEIDSYKENSDTDSRKPGQPLFTFTGPEPSWYTVNDNVMGGISTSSVRIDPDSEKLTFSGSVSLENNGGFASTRSDWVSYNLQGYDGILMRVFGDGNVYRFRIRTALTGPEVAYTALFETKAGTWQDVYIPFTDMIPTYRGFIVNSAGPIDPSAIRSFGLMVSDKQQGEFKLAVDWINAVAVKRNQITYAGIEFGYQELPSLVYATS